MKKAGLIPYVFEDNEPVFMFMVPSDPAFGGTRPAIAKGNIDPGEDVLQAAIREAEEELGLVKSNMLMDTLQEIWTGNKGYSLTVYMCEVKGKEQFVEPHYETGETHWLTADEFSKIGKLWQIPIVKRARSLL
jgi:8-oxo-dGTP pyrophosphatase MutT (NUDIX family)